MWIYEISDKKLTWRVHRVALSSVIMVSSVKKLETYTRADYEGSIRLLEIAQVPSEHVEDFKSGEFIYTAC